MPEDLKLGVSPEALSKEFMPLLALVEERSFLQLAKGLGSKDVSRPRRAIEKYLWAAEIFGFVTVSASGAVLTSKGLRFRGDVAASRASVRSAFYGARVPSSVLGALSATLSLSRDEASKRLATFGREAELDRWLEWLAYSGIISITGDTIVTETSVNRPLDLYLREEIHALQEERYRHLVATEFASAASNSPCSFRMIVQLSRELRSEPPDRAEAKMRRLTQSIFAALGVIVQVDNGPRESSQQSEKPKPGFGSQGDDAVGFFLRPPVVSAETSVGLILAMELKRTASDKKAVGQAVTAAGQWRAYFDAKPTVMAVTVSDSDAYSEKAAREYATSNTVVHLPLEALICAVNLQRERFSSAKSLITPVHIWTLLEGFRQTAYVEPTTQDIVEGLRDLLGA